MYYSIYILFLSFFLNCNNLRSNINEEIDQETIITQSNTSNNLNSLENHLDIKHANMGNNEELYSTSNSIKAKFSKDYPQYRIMYYGVSLEGYCPNPNCLVNQNKDYAWTPMSNYEKISETSNTKIDINNNYKCIKKNVILNLGKEIRNAKCPICNYYYDHVKAYGISNAKIIIETETENKEKKLKTIDTQNDSNKFIYQKLLPNKHNEYTKTNILISINENEKVNKK